MSNPLYQEMQKQQPPQNWLEQFMNNLNQLKATGGDPNQRIQQMLNSGQVTQEQYNQAVQKAKAIKKLLGWR